VIGCLDVCLHVYVLSGAELIRWWTAASSSDFMSRQAGRCLPYRWTLSVPRLRTASPCRQGHQKVSSASSL